jgi:hypothetical protein
MYPEHGAERPILEPAYKELAIGRIIGIATDKAADVGGPIGKP